MADIQKLKLNVKGVDTTYDISTTWDKVTGKPSTFTPSSHSHDDYLKKITVANNTENDFNNFSDYIL